MHLKRKRKLSLVLIIALLAMCLTACGGNSDSDTDKENKTEEAAATPTEEAGETVTEEITIQDGDFSKSAVDYVNNMGVGWNLGNSLDAYSGGFGMETAWGNPYITQELLHAVKEAGFDTIRIPVTYMGQIGAAPDYEVAENWMKRIQTVVDCSLEEGFYVIINIHHDGNNDTGAGAWLDVNLDDQTEVQAKFKAVWEQVAERFKGYDEHLMFESMNEIMEYGNYGNPRKETTYQNINALNQIFVDTVRASGANNAERYLLVPGYNTNISATLLDEFVLPKDSATNKLSVSVHFYDPWDFAGEGKSEGWGKDAKDNNLKTDSWGQEEWVAEAFSMLNDKFIKNGVPIILGEYGCVYQSEEREANRKYYINYVTAKAREFGACPIVWDNGSMGSGSDAFGIFDRNAGNTVKHPEYLDGIISAK